MGTRRHGFTVPAGVVPAVILAGGRATRMGGGDKPLRLLRGQPLLAHVLARLRPQACPIALNANGDPGRFAAWDLPILADPVQGQPGPLAGVLAAMLWARDLSARQVLTVPGDTPFLPCDLMARLMSAGAAGRAERPSLAASAGRLHPVVGLWPVSLAGALAQALAAGEQRVAFWALDRGAVSTAFAPGPPDPFTNLNSPADLAQAEAEG